MSKKNKPAETPAAQTTEGVIGDSPAATDQAVSQTPADNATVNQSKTAPEAAISREAATPDETISAANSEAIEETNAQGADSANDKDSADIEDSERDESAETANTEPEVKSGFQKFSLRAVCPNGDPFRGSYGSLTFSENGEAEVTIADAESLEDLKEQFSALEFEAFEIKQA